MYLQNKYLINKYEKNIRLFHIYKNEYFNILHPYKMKSFKRNKFTFAF